MHFPSKCLAGLLLAGAPLPADDTRPLNDPLLASLRAEAARNHPAAEAARERVAAADQDLRSVRLWDDPMVGLGVMGATRMMRMDEGDVILGVEQMLPKPGMFAAETGRMQAMRRAQAESAAGAALDAGAEAARAAIELALADEAVALQQAQVDWLAEMAKNAAEMAADPMAGGTDALRMETELAREREMLAAARRTRGQLAQTLNVILGRPLDSAWPVLTLPAVPLPVPVGVAEVARIPHANPKVRAMTEMTAAAAAEVRIADRERLPEVSVGVDARLYSGTGDVRSTMLGVKLTLPWFNDRSYRAKIDAAKSREAAAGRDVEAMRREVAAMVLAAATEAANAASQARAFGGEILAKAEKARETTEAAWISSKAPLTDLLDSSRMLFGIRLEQRRMVAMQLAALEELHALVPSR